MNQRKIIVCKGLPGSGKSTWAKKFVEDNGGWVRINRDDIRNMSGKYWVPEREDCITDMEIRCVASALSSGWNVVLDSTNFNPKVMEWISDIRYAGILNGNELEIEEKFFDVSLEECIRRDALREKPVGEKVIKRMYYKYINPKGIKNAVIEYRYQQAGLPEAYIFDIDGTIAMMDGRNPFDGKSCGTDKPNMPVINLLKSLESIGYRIILLSGRQDDCREETIKWLNDHEIHYDFLFMRQFGDNRKDTIIKREIYENIIEGAFCIHGIFDDRSSVVKMWRDELKLPCFQVYYGDF